MEDSIDCPLKPFTTWLF